MEVNHGNKGFAAGEDNNDTKCLQRHNYHMEAQIPHSGAPRLGRHFPEEQNSYLACNGTESVELKEGFLYEIEQLPRKSPIQVEGIRTVLVAAINEFNVSVRAPSIASLDDYFGNANSKGEMESGKKHPNLDKQFIMSLKLAKEIIVRQISPTEFSKQRHLRSFWMVPLKGGGGLTPLNNGDSKDETSVKGVCWSSLNSAGVLHWGNGDSKNETSVKGWGNGYSKDETSVKGRGNGDSKDETSVKRCGNADSKDETSVKEWGNGDSKDETSVKGWGNGDSKDETSVKGVCWSSLNSAGILHWGARKRISYVGRHNEKALRIQHLPSIIKKEEEEETEVKIKDETKIKIRKRKHEGGKQKKRSKAAKFEVKKSSNQISNPKLNQTYGWWSLLRYRNAEVKMFDILKAKGAVYGKPILRQPLRMEARKHIGDTGLLDHVLKHLTDKVAPNGHDRFRRRHRPDGAMEYWLESADLVNIRKEAGVSDPYWIPPPGWKPGDNSSEDPNFTRELKLLKEDISNIKKDVQELCLLPRDDTGNKAIVVSTEFSSESCYLESETEVVSLKQDYENLLKRKICLAQQLTKIRKLRREDLRRSRKFKDDTPEMKKRKNKINEQKLTLAYGRWCPERYKIAEVKMMEIMKAKGAVSGKPIVRQALRMEARKHIGDTGLLDHILKHMADKIAPNGADRFRRRHSPVGAMEYWLESADLVNIRTEAGIKDSYWVPPLGWRPGDSPSQEPNCARELKLLKEEMSAIEKDVQALLLDREDGVDAFVISTKSSSESCNVESDTGVVSFQEDYENLLNTKAQVEQQHAQISASLNGMQGTIASFLVGPHDSDRSGSSTIDMDSFFRRRWCDFVSS